MLTVNPEKHAAKRQQILQAAAVVFGRNGYDAATTSAICKEAGIGSGTLFHYFGDKRSLMMALFGDDITETSEYLGALDRTDPNRALWQVIERMTADLSSPLVTGLMAAAMQLALRDDEFAALAEAGDHATRVALADLISAGRSRGVFRDSLDPSRAARWIHAIVDACYLMTDGEGFDPASDRAELVHIIAGYLGDPDTAGVADISATAIARDQ